MKVCADGSLHLLLYLASSEFREVQSAATRALANLTQSIDCEPALRAPRAPSTLLPRPRPSPSTLALDPRFRPTLTLPLTPIVTLTLIPIVTLTLI